MRDRLSARGAAMPAGVAVAAVVVTAVPPGAYAVGTQGTGTPATLANGATTNVAVRGAHDTRAPALPSTGGSGAEALAPA